MYVMYVKAVMGSRRRLPPQAPRCIQGSSPYAPKATLGSVPCACVLVSPLYVNRLCFLDMHSNIKRSAVTVRVYLSLHGRGLWNAISRRSWTGMFTG